MKAYAAQLQRSSTERDRLIAEHLDHARRISLRMARRCPAWIAREDLVAAGMLGLTEAAARYDSSRNEPFLAFAEKRIRGAVLDDERRTVHVDPLIGCGGRRQRRADPPRRIILRSPTMRSRSAARRC